MAIFFEESNRLVLPNWRSFSNTAKIGELNGSKKLLIEKSFNPDISDLIDEWVDNQTIGMAGDLMGVALVCNKEQDENVIDAAKFIKSKADYVSKELLNTADLILNKNKIVQKPILDSDSIDSFQERANLYFVYQKISELKSRLRINPKNSVLWTEIARYYSIIGQNKKAERAIKNALNLSPQNRFVLRSMARFFTHIGDVGFAHDIIRKLPITNSDPWVMATEISLAMKRGRLSRFAKKGLTMVNSDNFHPFNIAELNSSLGTLEYESNWKKSKKLFESSLERPNDNVLAQAEWISHKESNFLKVNPDDFDVENSFEANARNSSENGEWQDAIDYAKLWFLDMPFSRGAILFGSQIAAYNMDDHDEAAYLYKAGLTSHPQDPQMINNLVYSLCLRNRIEEAEQFLEKFPAFEQTSVNNQICITATKGILNFRKGFLEKGRELYFQAIEKASSIKNVELTNLAFVNYLREEYLSGSEVEPELVKRLEAVEKTSKNSTTQKIIREIHVLKAKI